MYYHTKTMTPIDLVEQIVNELKKQYNTEKDLKELEIISSRPDYRYVLFNILHFLLYDKNNLEEINRICLIAEKENIEMIGLSYYPWAVYFASIGDKEKTKEMLIKSTKNGGSKGTYYEPHPLLLKIFNKKELDEILNEKDYFYIDREDKPYFEFPKKVLIEMINLMLDKYPKETKFLEKELESINKSKVMDLRIGILYSFLLRNKEFKEIYKLTNKIKKLGYEKDMSGLEYYCLSQYYKYNNDLINENKNLLIAKKLGYDMTIK